MLIVAAADFRCFFAISLLLTLPRHSSVYFADKFILRAAP